MPTAPLSRSSATLPVLAVSVVLAVLATGVGLIADTVRAADTAGFAPVEPVRDVDTRLGRGGGALAAGEQRYFALPSLPPSAQTATLNVTAVGAAADGHLTVTDCAPGSTTSAVNYVAGRATPNQVTVGLSGSPARGICVSSLRTTHVVVDVFGYTTGAATSAFAPVSGREWDTRTSGGIGADGVLEVDLGHRLADGNVVAWSGTITATAVTAPGFVTVYPCAHPRPAVSSLNLTVGVTKANQVTVAVPAGDPRLCAYREGSADLVIDTTGTWVTDPSATITPASPPQRIIDTRGGARVLVDEVRRLYVDDEAALFVNVTATGADADGWLALFACDAGYEGTSTLNIAAHEDVSSAAIIGAGDGGVCVTTSASTHVVVDVYAIQHRQHAPSAIDPGVSLLGDTLASGTPDDPTAPATGPCVEGALTPFNATRSSLGLPALVSDDRTDRAACDWARAMADADAMQHSPASFRAGVDACGVNGENVAAGGTSADWMAEGWLTSTAHLQNIVHPLFARASVAYVPRSSGGDTTWYGAMIFGGDC